MVGDRDWLAGLGYAYDEHLAMSVRRHREPQPFRQWATQRTWGMFLALARYCDRIGDFTRDDWATVEIPWAAPQQAFTATVLARAVLNAPIVCGKTLAHVKRRSRASHCAVEAHIANGKVERGQERALARGKRIIYQYLCWAAERDGALTRAV